MSEIENLAEGEAFMDAVDTILGLNHPLRDTEIARLRAAWIAGRDYQRSQASQPDPDLRVAAERLLERAASATDDQDDDEDAILVARAALAGQGGVGEVERLREAAETARSRALLLNTGCDDFALQDEILEYLGQILGPLPGAAPATSPRDDEGEG